MSPHPAIPPSRHPLLSADHLWPLAVLSCLFAFVSTHPIRPHDFWWHMAVGREIVQTGHIPQVDHYSHTMPGQPYPSYNVYWLADVALYRIYALGGPALSLFVHALLITGTYLLLYLLCLRLARGAACPHAATADTAGVRTRPPTRLPVHIATAALVGAAALGFENWNLRPQAVTFLLFTLVLWLIYRFRMELATPRWLLLGFPALTLVWVNCHGSFPLELVMLGIWLVETAWERVRIGPRSRRQLWVPALALILSALALLLNPQGAGIFGYLRAMGANPVVQQLPEWTPASLTTGDGIAYFIFATLGLALLLWAGRARSGLFHWLPLVFFGILAARTGRAIIWFGLVLAPIAAELLPRVLQPSRDALPDAGATGTSPRGERVVLAFLMALFLGLAVIALPWFKHRLPLPPAKAGLISRETPVAATDFLLRHQLPAQVFHYSAYGSYLIWAAAPRYRVFVDPRIELYPASLWDTYHALSRGDPGWPQTLDRYHINTLLLSRADQPGLIAAARTSPLWQQVYEDDVAVIFVRREPPR